MNPLYEQMSMNGFVQRLNQLKQQGGDPNQKIQSMLSSGRVTQAQYDNAVKRAQNIMQMLTPSVRR